MTKPTDPQGSHPAPADTAGVGKDAAGPSDVAGPASAAGEPAEDGPAPPNGKPVEPPTAAVPPPWQRMPAAEPGAGSESAPNPGSSDLGSARTVALEQPTADQRATDPDDGAHAAAPSTAQRPGSRPESTTPPGGFPISWPRNRRPRQASLQLKRLDPWSVLKMALVLAVALYLIWLVAVGVLYGMLDGLGVWERLNGQYADLVAAQTGDQLISAGRVFGIAAIVGAINSLLFAVAVSVAAFIYNVSADLVGGIEVTLSERD